MVGQSSVNGVNTAELKKTAGAILQNPQLGSFKFHVRNQWIDGGYNRTRVENFQGAGREWSHSQQFDLAADEPPVLLGADRAPNPVEHLLNALVSCLTSSMVYHAASRGIRISRIESEVEGDLDIRGFMGLDPSVRKGYQHITVHFKVNSDGDAATLEQCARFSPVFDVVSRGTQVDLEIEKM